MFLLLALVLVGQALVAPAQAYTTPGGLLETPDGQYALTFGHNCDAIALGANVEVWRISNMPDQAVLAPIDDSGLAQPLTVLDGGGVESQMCSAYIDRTADQPCFRNADGACDIAFDPAFVTTSE